MVATSMHIFEGSERNVGLSIGEDERLLSVSPSPTRLSSVVKAAIPFHLPLHDVATG